MSKNSETLTMVAAIDQALAIANRRKNTLGKKVETSNQITFQGYGSETSLTAWVKTIPTLTP